ncbi:MAG TPA: ABC transporter substrate-binding protein [Bacteroidales bacterium]|nr:ABC transporter substrate-binding protein [Bacteroidales bacterium]
MKQLLKDLWLAVTLILAATVILLLSDRQQRLQSDREHAEAFPDIAIMQINSTSLLDAHVEGVISRLKEKGYYAHDGSNVRRFNPQGDFSTANSIAGDIVNGPYKIVITSSTVAMQVFAKANQKGKKIHVFGAVTDPFGTGTGINGPEPNQRPAHIAGIGTFQPVERAFEIIKELNPKIKRVGVVWNPGEQCSEACLLLARAFCKSNGIELIEANATNTSEVSDALRSLIARNVEAIWIGGDTVATASIRMIINIASDAGIPVFTNDPSDADAGALFGLGADYFTVGQFTADIAVKILEGADPTSFSIKNVLPELLRFNHERFNSLSGQWTITPKIKELIEQSDLKNSSGLKTLDFALLKEKGIEPDMATIEQAERYLNLSVRKNRPSKVAIINLVENLVLDEAEQGVYAAFDESGLQPDKDYVIKKYSAQGEIAQLPQIIDAVVQEHPDVIITITTPALIAIAKKKLNIPVVFTVASDPYKLNIFRSGRPDNICGVHDNPPVGELLDMAIIHIEDLTAVGIVYDAAQMNSLISVEKLRKAGKEKNIHVFEATASSINELVMATQSLIQRGAQVIILSADNLAYTGFSSIFRVTQASDIPVYTTDPSLVEQGATAAYGDSFFEWGKQSGKMAIKILAGMPPEHLSITETVFKQRIEPKEGKTNPVSDKKFQLRMVLYSETEFAERCRDGLLDGIKNAGFVENQDYDLRIYNAQGDMSTLSSIMNTVKADRVDLLMVISTPTLQAALRQAGSDTRIVFTGVGDGVRAGAGNSETDHLPDVTGITTRSPFEGMARIIKSTLPSARRVGTLFTPAEINSELYKNWFKEALKKEGIELVTVPVTSSADVAQAAAELCGNNIDLLCQVVDNLTRPGFALISRKAAENQLPVYVFDSDQMKHGGAIGLSRDYYDAGLEAAALAVRVLRGESPSSIPFMNTRSEKLLINKDLAKKYNLIISNDLWEKATIFSPEKD